MHKLAAPVRAVIARAIANRAALARSGLPQMPSASAVARPRSAAVLAAPAAPMMNAHAATSLRMCSMQLHPQSAGFASDAGLTNVVGERVDISEFPADQCAVETFDMSPKIKEHLQERGITQLFPVQAAVFEGVRDGKDLIARSRTGTGKTYAFLMPLVERIRSKRLRAESRSPRVVILAPTRELCKQIYDDFVELAPDLKGAAVYGGASPLPQRQALQKGVHFVMATPGRLLDLNSTGAVAFDKVETVVLDEADEMLRMGFEQQVESIITQVPSKTRQTLLFSATIPEWVEKMAHKYLKSPMLLDAVGNTSLSTPATIRHLAVVVPDVADTRMAVVRDLVAQYEAKRVLVFCMQKRMVESMADAARKLGLTARTIHGDITQAAREANLYDFREGRAQLLVATDVAARGLDIDQIDMVIHTEMPNHVESFVHRSGRTGRAGASGINVLMLEHNERRDAVELFSRIKAKFEFIPAPSPLFSLEVSARALVNKAAATAVPSKVRSQLTSVVQSAQETLGDEALLKLFTSVLMEHTVVSRSALTGQDNWTTLTMRNPKRARMDRYHVLNVLDAICAKLKVRNSCGKIVQLVDGGAAVDVPTDMAETFVQEAAKMNDGNVVEVATAVPNVDINSMSETRVISNLNDAQDGASRRSGPSRRVYESVRNDRRGGQFGESPYNRSDSRGSRSSRSSSSSRTYDSGFRKESSFGEFEDRAPARRPRTSQTNNAWLDDLRKSLLKRGPSRSGEDAAPAPA